MRVLLWSVAILFLFVVVPARSQERVTTLTRKGLFGPVEMNRGQQGRLRRDPDFDRGRRFDDDGGNSAFVRFVPVNQSGIVGFCVLRQVTVNNTPALHFKCHATGFDKDSPYVSLVYDVQSIGPNDANAILVGQPNVCRPGLQAGQAGALTLAQMVPGGNPYWTPLVGATSRTLEITSFTQGPGGNFVSLGALGTMSIRRDTAFGPAFQINANRLQIQACGDIVFGN